MPPTPSSESTTDQPLRVLLVDDERLARKYLHSLLGEHSGVIVVGEANSVASAAELTRQLQPDVIFLDVQMPPESGFDLLPLLDPAPAIVFVTAHDEFAVRAFAASAADYLLKPVTTERLALALQHARQHQHAAGRLVSTPAASATSAMSAVPATVAAETAASPVLGLDDTLILRDTGRLRRARVRDVAALVAEGSYTRVYLSDERSMLVLRRMAAWETSLPAPPFLRAERSMIINLERVADLVIRSREEGTVTLLAEGASKLELGRVALTRLRAALAE